MEIVIPLIGLAGLYIVSNHDTRVGYTNPRQEVPQTPKKKVTFVDLAGREINTNDYTKKMVPFFGKTKNIGTALTNFQHAEHELDNMTGDGTYKFRKTETAPLFKPEETFNSPFGMLNNNNFIQERMVVGHKMNNVKPFQEKQVGPGINQGYTTEGSGGFNSGTEFRNLWLDKTVDELRVVTNPKETFMLTNHEGPAQNLVKNLGIQAKVEKNLPDTFFENTPDRYLVTPTSGSLAPTVRSTQPDTLGHRMETSTEYGGIAARTGPEAPTKHGMYKLDSRQQLGAPPVNPSQGLVPQTNLDNVRPQVLPTNRSFTHESYGGLGSLVSAITAPIKDMIRPTRKEELIHVHRTGNAGSVIPNAPMPDKIVPTTIKETTMFSPLEMGARPFTNIVEGGYQISEQNVTATERDTTNTSYMGNPGSSHQRVYDTYYTPSNDKTVAGRQPIGNTNMFSPMMNQTSSSSRSELHTSYVGAPQTANQMMGPEQYKQTRVVTSYEEPSRNETSLLDAFKKNPYTHSLQSAVPM